jgi:hypothetical protein
MNIYDVPYDEWVSRFHGGAGCKADAWDFYNIVKAALPDKYRLPLFMDCVYTWMDILPDESAFEMELKYLIDNEPIEAKENRLIEICKKLNDMKLLDGDGYLNIYRGIHTDSFENAMGIFAANKDIEQAISYTLNPVVGRWFSIRTKAPECKLVSAKMHYSNVLHMRFDRQESEVIIVPPYLGGKLLDVKTEYLIPEIQYMQEFDKLRAS